MTLTSLAQAELIQVVPAKTAVRQVELSSFLRFSGGLHTIGGRIAVEAEVSSVELATKIRRDMMELYGVKSEGRIAPASAPHAAPTYIVRVIEAGETLARQTGLLDARRRPIRGLPNRLTTANQEELAALWRGAFLASGAITDPGRSAALEVVCPTNEAAMALVGAANRLGIPSKAREVRGVHRVLIREDDAISRMLSAIEASSTLDAWREMRQRREVRATANRLVNFDDANLRRSAQAAVAACARVERAMEILGDEIPDHLAYAGNLRLTHRDASLDELGHHATPPMTKDAVAGRIRRLLALADKIASERGIPGTDANLPDDFEVD